MTHYFGKKGVTPGMAAAAAISFACEGLATAANSSEARDLLNLVSDESGNPLTPDAARALLIRMRPFYLPDDRTLAIRPDVVTPAIRTVENCIQSVLYFERSGDEVDAWKRIASAFVHASAVLTLTIERESRRKGAQRKLDADPKQLAKVGARKLWEERREGKHPKLKTTEQFATEVLRRWPVLTSSKVVCGWSAAWNKEKRRPQPAS